MDTGTKEVVRKAQQGDQKALRVLLKKYHPLFVRKSGIPGVFNPAMESKEEVIQDCSMALVRAVKTYREDKGTFTSWVFTNVSAVVSKRRKRKHPVDQIIDDIVGGVEDENGVEGEWVTPEGKDAGLSGEHVQGYIQRLNDEEQLLLNELTRYGNLNRIPTGPGKTYQTLRNRINRIRAKVLSMSDNDPIFLLIGG